MSLSLQRIRAHNRPLSAWIVAIFALVVGLSGFAHTCSPAEAAAAHQPVGAAVVDSAHGEHPAPHHVCPACTWQAEAGNGGWAQAAVNLSIPVPCPRTWSGGAPLRSLRHAHQPQRGPPSA